MVLDKCSVFLMKIDLMFCSILSFTECDVEPLEGRHLLSEVYFVIPLSATNRTS